MTEPNPYRVDFTPGARRGMNRLPLPAAAAMFEHLTGPVAGNPNRAICAIDEEEHSVTIIAVAHRRDAYRTS